MILSALRVCDREWERESDLFTDVILLLPIEVTLFNLLESPCFFIGSLLRIRIRVFWIFGYPTPHYWKCSRPLSCVRVCLCVHIICTLLSLSLSLSLSQDTTQTQTDTHTRQTHTRHTHKTHTHAHTQSECVFLSVHANAPLCMYRAKAETQW